MTVNDEAEIIQKEAALDKFKILPQQLCGETKVSPPRKKLELLVSRPRFERVTS
jgi:hypothetical protein